MEQKIVQILRRSLPQLLVESPKRTCNPTSKWPLTRWRLVSSKLVRYNIQKLKQKSVISERNE